MLFRPLWNGFLVCGECRGNVCLFPIELHDLRRLLIGIFFRIIFLFQNLIRRIPPFQFRFFFCQLLLIDSQLFPIHTHIRVLLGKIFQLVFQLVVFLL